MSTPGDPFKTEEMEEVRSRQRRLVRELAQAVFARATRGRLGLEDHVLKRAGADKELMEVEIRQLADEELSKEPVAELVAALRRDGRREHLMRAIGNLRLQERGFDDILNTLEEENNGRLIQLPNETAEFMYRAVQLLLLADELAEDGYMDPRLLGSV